MSENHPAENHLGSSDTNQGAKTWYSGWEEFSEGSGTEETSPSEGDFPSTPEQDWHPVDPPQALRVSDLETASLPQDVPPPPPIDLPNWSVRTIPPQAPLVSMVSTQATPPEPSEPPLDVAELISLIQELNQCNSALLDRVAQLEDALEQRQTTAQGLGQSSEVAPTTVSAEQVTQLLQELEKSHQSSQRQQVLIETLSEQLNSSQDRIAQLERDQVLAHQRLQEQQQQLMQGEQMTRDLQVRLQRQQRYTLQFKAALERCLEVSTPPFDLPDMSAANASVADAVVNPLPPPPLSPKIRQIQPWSSAADASLPLKLDSLRGRASVNPNHTAASSPMPTPEPPLASLDAAPPPPPPAVEPAQPDPELQASSNALQAAAAELKSVLANLLQQNEGAEQPRESDVWKDLARMAEVSSEDVVRASQTEADEVFANPLPVESPPSKPSISMPSEVFQQRGQSQGGIPSFTPPDAESQARTGNSPAPVVYPFRPLKKIDSLAAVDLPTFPRPTA